MSISLPANPAKVRGYLLGIWYKLVLFLDNSSSEVLNIIIIKICYIKVIFIDKNGSDIFAQPIIYIYTKIKIPE